MSSDIAIRVENLGKRYVIGREVSRAPTLAGRVDQTLASPFSWLTSRLRGPSDEEILWALNDRASRSSAAKCLASLEGTLLRNPPLPEDLLAG